MPQDLLVVVVTWFFLGSRFGMFPAELVINPDVITKQKSEEDNPYDDPERIIIIRQNPKTGPVVHFPLLKYFDARRAR
jgi:hypothetical protein